jgi:gas vesicle protein
MSNSEYSFSGRTLILSLFAGAIAGAAAVLLLAPKVRQESAERIRELSHDLQERASATIDATREKVASTVARGREMLEEERAVISEAVEAGKEAYARRKARVPGSDQEPV